MLWIALYLPDLSLQLASRATLSAAAPVVIFDGPANRPVVFSANAAARVAGVSINMSLAAACALVTDLQTLPRAIHKDDAALCNLVALVTQFTTLVAILLMRGIMLVW